MRNAAFHIAVTAGPAMHHAVVRRVIAPLLVLLGLLAAPMTAGADQGAPELDDLFTALQSGALSFGEAKGIEVRIWGHWMDAESAGGDILMKDGLQAMSEHDLARAEESFTALTDLLPDYAEGWNKRATVRYHMGRYGASLDDIERTLALEPRHFGAMSGLGLVHDALGDREAAAAAYAKALELNPYMPSIAQRLGILRQQMEEKKI